MVTVQRNYSFLKLLYHSFLLLPLVDHHIQRMDQIVDSLLVLVYLLLQIFNLQPGRHLVTHYRFVQPHLENTAYLLELIF